MFNSEKKKGREEENVNINELNALAGIYFPMERTNILGMTLHVI